MRILTYNDIDREEWSALVKASATGTWFQTPEAYCFYASQPDLFRPFVVGIASSHPSPEGKGERLRGVCVGYVTVEKSAFKQFLTRRAIIIGGPCLVDDATNEEVIALLEAVKTKTRNLQSSDDDLPSIDPQSARKQVSGQTIAQSCAAGAESQQDSSQKHASLTKNSKNIFHRYAPIYIETRNFNDYSRWKDAFERAGFEYMPHLNFHVECRDERQMWERLSENRKRQIKKQQPTQTLPKGKAYRIAQSEDEIREWYEILAELYRAKVKTPLWSVEFFLEAYRQGVGKFLLVKHEGKVIGGSMVVVWKPNPDPSLKGREQESFASVWGAHTADSMQYNLLKENAIANRKTPTEAEAILWDLLKGNNIGLHFRRQHIVLDYIVDFICLDKGLVIELDGGYHNNPEQKEYDEQRTAHLQRLGYTELRFTNEELLVNPDSVVAKIKEVASKLPSLKGRTEERLGTVYEWFECGLNAEYKEQYPSVMATWEGMQYAQETGCSRYDMMGAGVPGIPYGVRDFKSEFGGELVEHGRFLCVNKPMLYQIGKLGVRLLKALK